MQRRLSIEETYLALNTPVSPIVLPQPDLYGLPALASHTADGGSGRSAGGAGGARAGMVGGRCRRGRRWKHEGGGNPRRRLTNAIFRVSGKMHLHTVLSGYPPCPEILDAVCGTIAGRREVPEA